MPLRQDHHAPLVHSVTGAGPPLVLVHAGIADSTMWDEAVPALAARYTVLRYDLRGFGRSAPPTAAYSDVEDLRDLLDHLGYGRVHLVGASWGGRIALDFALAHPGRVRSLAAFAPPWPGWDWGAAMVAYDAAETAAREAGDLDAAVRVDLDMWLRGPRRTEDEVDGRLLDRMRGPVRTALVHQEALERYAAGPGEGDPGALTVPALIGVGTLDVPDFQDIAARYTREIPGARLVTFPGAGHLLTLEQPEAFTRTLLPFLAEAD
ncbi:alpha/beta hydrolase [Streptomyces sp. NPDC049954]|uniref:alpha/beta fold hydrolase n=1 Tax=Streptomyces sp. NPDC049954 TaxID=3155779 RepID=UPI0034125908